MILIFIFCWCFVSSSTVCEAERVSRDIAFHLLVKAVKGSLCGSSMNRIC